jgi:asparagine synthase (glutamine-hydrolysing)
VAELALALPVDLRVRGLQTKRLLRQAVAPLLPADVVRGPKKGFVAPAAAWLRGPLEGFARDVLGSAGLYDARVALGLLDRHVARREDLSRPLWGLLALGAVARRPPLPSPARRPLEIR